MDSYHTPFEEIERAQAYWNEYLITGSCELLILLANSRIGDNRRNAKQGKEKKR